LVSSSILLLFLSYCILLGGGELVLDKRKKGYMPLLVFRELNKESPDWGQIRLINQFIHESTRCRQSKDTKRFTIVRVPVSFPAVQVKGYAKGTPSW